MTDSVLINEIKYSDSGDVTIAGNLLEDGRDNPTVIRIISTPEATYRGALTPSANSTRVKKDVELFRLTDLASVMDKEGWSVAAALQREWFRRKPLVMAVSEKNNLLSSRPALDYINDSLLSYDWLMKHKRMHSHLQNLKDNLLSPNAKKAIVRILKENGFLTEKFFRKGMGGSFSADRSLLNGNRRLFHKRYQFQFKGIDQALNEQAARAFKGSDDLWAAFGGFSLYAALGDITLYSPTDGYCAITLNNFVCYAIDTYEFIGDDQYLGHWNKSGVKVVPASLIEKSVNDVSPPVHKTVTDLKTLYNLFFCVRNEHFNRYRQNFGIGGDMFVWTKPALYTLDEKEFTFYEPV